MTFVATQVGHECEVSLPVEKQNKICIIIRPLLHGLLRRAQNE